MPFQFISSMVLPNVTIDLTLQMTRAATLIKNEENKIVPTKSLMFNVLVGEI